MTDQLDRLTTSLANRYRIERELGAGGMATVYLAEDLKHKRKVAIKVLRPELAATLGPERFVREIEIPRYVEAASASQPPAEKPELFGSVDDETLLGFGVPVEWLADVRQATEDTLFDVAEYLPGEAAEAIAERAEQEQPADALASRITSVTKWYGLPPEVEFCLAQFLWRLYTGGVLLEELEPHDYLESITEEQIRDFVEDNLGPALRTRDRGFPHYASALLAQLSVLYLNYFM